jgi:hypothetical protein
MKSVKHALIIFFKSNAALVFIWLGCRTSRAWFFSKAADYCDSVVEWLMENEFLFASSKTSTNVNHIRSMATAWRNRSMFCRRIADAIERDKKSEKARQDVYGSLRSGDLRIITGFKIEDKKKDGSK